MLYKFFNIRNICILIILLLTAEIFARLTGPNPFEVDRPHFWETNFQYDSYFGWISKPNFRADLKPYGFGDIIFDERGFPILPNIKNDTVVNKNKILFIGSCDTYGGPMLGPEKSYINLFAEEMYKNIDLEVIGVGGYLIYQKYLLNQRFNKGGYDVVIVFFCPSFDFNLNSKYYMHKFGNRLMPHPRIKNGKIIHDMVPYVKSYWEHNTPPDVRFSFLEKIFQNFYCLSKIIKFWVDKKSFDVNLTQHIIKALQKDVEEKGGKLVLLIYNWLPDIWEPELNRTTDEFLFWLKQENIGVIDVRKKLIGYSLAKFGDPTHINFEGQQIIKDEIKYYLKNILFLTN